LRTRLSSGLFVAGLIIAASRAAAQATAGPIDDCTSELALCLEGERFLIESTWNTPDGLSGSGHAVGLTDESGYFWFFDAGNIELVVKMLDGCATDGRQWFFSAGLTNLEVTITATDRATGEARNYSNPQGQAFASILDTAAFSNCSVVPLLVTLSRYQFSPGGPEGPPIRLTAGVTYAITFRSIDVVHGISAIPVLGIASREVAPGADYVVSLTPTPVQRGRYNFACTRVCGPGHGGMFGAIEVE
jgi:heme/copper-type cytochrome/quinol oxidase subunit 2